MGEETATQVQSTEGVAATVTPQEQSEATVIADSVEPTIGKAETKSLFGEVAPTEAELMGEEEPEPPAEEQPPEEKKEEAVAEEKKPVEEPKKPEPPPKGFVPLQALHEERGRRQSLEQEILRLRRENDALLQLPEMGDAEKPDSDFKVLTDAEEDALMEEDIVAYQKYAKDLRKYTESQRAKVATEAHDAAIIESSLAAMNDAVPGIFDESSNANKALTGFAAAHGLPPQVLSVLTDPKTRVILPGQKQPVLMGKATVELVKFIRNTFMKVQQAAPVDRDAVKKEIEAELRNTLTKEITQEVMGKITNNRTGYRNIDQAPGSSDIPKTGPFSEADMAKLTPEQLRVALGG